MLRELCFEIYSDEVRKKFEAITVVKDLNHKNSIERKVPTTFLISIPDDGSKLW